MDSGDQVNFCCDTTKILRPLLPPPPPPLQMVNNDLLWKLQSCQAGGTFFFFLARSAFAPAYLLKSCVSVPFVLHVF